MKNAVFAKAHLLTQHTIGADAATGTYRGLRMHDRRRMNFRAFHDRSASTSIKVTSASLTGSELTEQTPLARPILPRDLVSSTSIRRVSPGRTGFRHLTLSAAMK